MVLSTGHLTLCLAPDISISAFRRISSKRPIIGLPGNPSSPRCHTPLSMCKDPLFNSLASITGACMASRCTRPTRFSNTLFVATRWQGRTYAQRPGIWNFSSSV